MFQNITQSMNNKIFFNDSKQRMKVLYCSKRIARIIKKNNVKTQWRLLMFELSLLV